jgi:hypothetical protein
MTLRLAHGRGNDIMARLQSVGYFLEDRDLYRASWALRSEPAEYEVRADFPRLTPVEMNRLGLANGAIEEVSYRLNLEGIKSNKYRLVPDIKIPKLVDD